MSNDHTHQTAQAEAVQRRRLIFRAWHRGQRETDLILGRFADAHVPGFTPEQLAQFEDVLGCNDPDLYEWITGREAVPPEHDHGVMRMLVGFECSAHHNP